MGVGRGIEELVLYARYMQSEWVVWNSSREKRAYGNFLLDNHNRGILSAHRDCRVARPRDSLEGVLWNNNQ